MGVGLKPDQGPKWGKHHRYGHHDAYQRGGNPQLDDHHPVQSTDQQHQGHTDGYLKQRKPQQAAQRQIRCRYIGKRKKTRPEIHPGRCQSLTKTCHVDLSQ